MLKITKRLWGVFLFIIYWCARALITLTKTPIRGAFVAIWSQGQILVIRKSYRKGWWVPGGLLNKGETWEQAAVRETFEEVGMRIDEAHLVFIKEMPGDLGPNDRIHLFEVEIDRPEDVKIDGREIIGAEFITPQEALKLDLYEHVKKYIREHAAP